MFCAGVGFILITVFYYKFPDIRSSFLGYWLKRIPIERKTGIKSVLSEFGALLILYFSWAMIIASLTVTPDLEVKSLPTLPVQTLASLILVTIFIEELVFRGAFLFVSFIAQRLFNWNIGYAMGLISSVAFGLAHLANYGQVTPVTLSLITIQTLGGLIFWWIAKRYSFMTAIWCHLAIDAMVMLPALLVGRL